MDKLNVKVKDVQELGVVNALVYTVIKQQYEQFKEDSQVLASAITMGLKGTVQDYKSKYDGKVMSDNYLKCTTTDIIKILHISMFKIDTAIKELAEIGLIDVMRAGVPSARYVKVTEV